MRRQRAARSLEATVGTRWGSLQADLGPHALRPHDEQWVRHVGRRLGQQAAEITEGFVAWCAELFPRVRMPGGDLGPLNNSVHDNMVTMWAMVANGLEPEDVDPPPNALLWPRKMIQARVPLGTLMRVYYVGHAMIWHRWVQPELEELAARGVDTTIVSARLHSLSFNYLDRAALRVAEQYYTARMELANPSSRAQLDAVQDILAGAQLTPGTRQALGFPIDGAHRAWTLWLTPAAAGRWPGLAVLAQRVHAALGGSEGASGLTIENGHCEIWGWTADPVELDGALLQELRQLLATNGEADPHPLPARQVAAQRGLRLALGASCVGVPGFRDGHNEVRSLHAAMDRARSLPDRVMTCSEAGLAALLMSDPQGARRFAHRRLGALAAPTTTAETLRATLRHLLANGGSTQRTAEELGVHRNTVLHRLRRCEAELGHAVRDAEQELFAALLILDWLPERI